jgi:tol-pal system protein YbgF
MDTHLVRMLLVSSLLALASGCTPFWKGRDMQRRIDELEKEQTKLQREYDREKKKLEKMVEGARADIDELRSVLEKARRLLQRNNADLGAEIQNVRQTIQKLRGQIEETQFKMSQLQRELELFKRDVEMRFAGGGGSLPDDPKELFEAGRSKLESGSLRVARRAFEQYLRNHGDGEYADEAQFYLAETYFRGENWVNAIMEYRKVLQSHSNSPKKPEATYKIGVGFMKLGKCKESKPFFETVVSDYPRSEVVSGARRQLRQLEQGACS